MNELLFLDKPEDEELFEEVKHGDMFEKMKDADDTESEGSIGDPGKNFR